VKPCWFRIAARDKEIDERSITSAINVDIGQNTALQVALKPPQARVLFS